MTRINCVPVSELETKFLLAEYRELPRISALAWKAVKLEIPSTYRLGTGHVKFFYDKGGFLKRRFETEIVPELINRGVNVQFTQYRPHPNGMNKDWTPDEESMSINRKRIQDRRAGLP